jgi:hypothetical protein
MALTTCIECGHKISDLAASCPSCGAPQKVAITAVAPPRKKQSKVPGVLAVVIALSIMAFFTLGKQSDDKAKGGNNDAQSDVIMIGESAIFRDKPTEAWPACKSLDDLDRIFQLVSEHDTSAAMNYALVHGCPMIYSGTETRVEDASLFHAAYCVRKSGQPDCLWTKKLSVESAAAWNEDHRKATQ